MRGEVGREGALKVELERGVEGKGEVGEGVWAEDARKRGGGERMRMGTREGGGRWEEDRMS